MHSYYDLMIDTETMGKAPDGAVVSIGAVFFDLHTLTMGPTFYRRIHLSSAVALGGRMDPSTVLWWLGQSDAARNELRFGGEPIVKVLGDFADWIKETCRHEDVRPWGNSPRFDMSVISGPYRAAGMKEPWYWANERDFRTVRHMHPSIDYDLDSKGDGAHNALDDAKFQVEHLFKIKNRRAQPA